MKKEIGKPRKKVGIGPEPIDLEKEFGVNWQMSREERENVLRALDGVHRRTLLEMMYPREFKSHAPFLRKGGAGLFERPSEELLKTEYDKLTRSLTSSKETNRTASEARFRKLLKSSANKDVLSSIWIGSHCVDLFIPNVRSVEKHPDKIMRGLAIEIDGDVHHREGKMKKDTRKLEELSEIGIGVTHIFNWDQGHPTVRRFIEGYQLLTVQETRERRRMWRRIHLLTLATHLSDLDFFELFWSEKIRDRIGK